jgi:hypothetical protein
MSMPILRRAVIAALASFTTLRCAVAESQTVRVRGTITSVTGSYITVATREGHSETVAVPEGIPVLLIVPARIEDIRPGSYIGTTALPRPDGTLMATEVHVFPESMRGVGEGHRPWDLQPGSTMTNGTVGDVVGTSGRRLTVKYNGGEKIVDVPPQAPIITYEPGNRAMLVPGAHVIVFAAISTGGVLRAQRIGVGKDRLTPPM